MGSRAQRHGVHRVAYVAAAAMTLLCLQGCIRVPGPTPFPGCTPPPGEEKLLADYRDQTVFGVLPAAVTETPHGAFETRYCQVVGVDERQYSTSTAITVRYLIPGYWSVQTLLSVYAAVASKSGWRLISTADAWASPGLKTTGGLDPSHVGTGLLFCKAIDEVTTLFAVDSNSRPDNPDAYEDFDLTIFARRDAPSCASSP
jgi:hypothetical protein